MLKQFEKMILIETLNILQDNYNIEILDNWKNKGSAYSISIYKDSKVNLYVYFGIRFVKNRNYIIPYIRTSAKEIKFANECENNFNVDLNGNLSCINSNYIGITLYKCDFEGCTNTSSEIMEPTKELMTSLLTNEYSFNYESAKKHGVTKLNFSPEMIKTWELFEEIFFIDSIEDWQVHTIIKPVLKDIDRIFCKYYLPFIKKLIYSIRMS
ncbi:hypothetical protein [Psychrobacter sp. I-STPA6b]|uniref:hypothetical protein n=1 Tax=Psychrobacter sp. I-STPA6b TaxID=2585718 RepID=UPI001D0C6903|nr:hypothetical protein [Psychrobacter sp. I-STPA6b]